MMKIRLFGLMISMFCSSYLMAQSSVSGTVKDSSGEPLVGVTVQEKGTTNGTITDLDGKYSLTVSSGDVVLVFSSVGFAAQEVALGGRTSVSVSMKEDVTELGEVIVSALGFKEEKDKLGSTSSVVNSSDMVRSGEAGLINGLAGKAAGVRVARSNGDPGAGTSIQIRGFNTIGGDSQPLIIVDGVPINNASENGFAGSSSGDTSQQSRLNDINQNDVESVTVLKGASAAALWGSRAANGVIVITTKKGKAGDKVNISFSSTYSVDEINRKFPTQTKFGQGSNGRYAMDATNSWGDKISEREGGADIQNTASGTYFEALDGTKYYAIAAGTAAEPHGGKRDKTIYSQSNFDQVFQKGHFLDNNLSISGGNDKSQFYFSIGDLNQEGIIRTSDYRRTTVRLNNDYYFNDWLSMSTKATYAKTHSNRTQQSSNTRGVLLGLLRQPADFDMTDYKGTYYNSGSSSPNAHRAYRRNLGSSAPAYNNPLWTLYEQDSPSDVDRFVMASELNIIPTSWLTITSRVGADMYTDRRETFFPVNTAGQVSYEEEVIRNREMNYDAIARMVKDLSSNIKGSLTVGFNVNDRQRTNDYVLAQNPLINTDLRNFANYTDFQPENTKRFIRSNRLYATAGIDIGNQVFVNVSGVSERASSIKGGFFYPSSDIAWQFTKMEALKNISFLSFGKLRASYGQVGVQPAAHRFNTTYETFSYNTYDDGLNGLYFGGGFRLNDDKGNDKLKPEIKTEFEIGADLRLFNDKLAFGITYYSNEITDMLLDVALAQTTGFNNIYDNAGTMENKGIEFDFDYSVLKEENYWVNLYGNYNRNRNKVTDLSGTSVVSLTTQSIQAVAVVGHPLSSLYGTKAERDEDGKLVLDANGFPIISSEQGIIGDPNPDWRGGLGIRAGYKNLTLNVLFETYQGADYADRTRFVLYAFGTHADVGKEVTLTQDLVNSAGTTFTAGTTVRGNIEDFGAGPVLKDERWYTTLGGGLGGSAINEFAIADGSWTRLRELSLTYSLKKDWVSKLKLSSVDLTLTGRNLFLWSDIKGIDPEINQSGVDNGFGIDYFTNPSTKSYLFSIRINY